MVVYMNLLHKTIKQQLIYCNNVVFNKQHIVQKVQINVITIITINI